MRTMAPTVTHITGPTLNVCGRVIQRCSLCGEMLCDSKNTAQPLKPDGSEPEFPTWETGRLVQQTVGGNPTRWLLLPDTDQLPKDSCLDLVE